MLGTYPEAWPKGKETYRRELWAIGMLIVVLLVSEASMQNFMKNKSVTKHRQLIDCALAAGVVAVKADCHQTN